METLLLLKAALFLSASLALGWLTRTSLRDPRCHGFPRFFAWEAIVALVLWNVDHWFCDPFSPHQVASWLLLCVSGVLVVLGVRTLWLLGKPSAARDDASLVGLERTTRLVTEGVYRYIRHPMYSSLLFLAWGVFFKLPSWPGAALVLVATPFLALTAWAEEVENRRFFGPGYDAYVRRTKRFIPFIV
jgi:protein-S-isoprenylcysteine O-methyltransferase Ste14